MNLDELVGTFRRTCDAAPVQYEGTVGDLHFYFRARWNGWNFGVGLTEEEAVDTAMYDTGLFSRSSTWGDYEFAASWMPFDMAEEIIRRCIDEFLAESNVNPVDKEQHDNH